MLYKFKIMLALLMFSASTGCAYHQSFQDAITPDSVQIGVAIDTDQMKVGPIVNVTGRWDLK